MEKQVKIWRGVAIAALCLLLVVGILYALGVGWKKADAKANEAEAASVTEAENGTDRTTEAAEAAIGQASEDAAKPTDKAELTLWTADSAARAELVAYMEAITAENGADYIPVENRIAVFDLDGTLFCETDPNYFDYTLLVHRVLEDPDYIDKASDFERETALKIVEQNRTGASFAGLEVDHGKCIASAFAGMTVEEFNAYIQEFKKLPMPSYEGMLRGEGWYKPMLEVVQYLQDNDFTVYIVSGTDRFIVRGIVDNSPLNIPPRQIIGSDESLVAPDQGDTDGLDYVFDDDDRLVLGGEFLIKNLKMNKVTVIMQEIGVQPVLSFGNSTGDGSMAEYVTSNNPYRSLAFMLCCDDTERENGSESKANKMFDLCAEFDWVPVSMKNDWTTIYGDGVTYLGQTKEDAAPEAAVALPHEYTLEQVTVLSRHNLRAPLSSNGSVPSELTPHEWISWTANASELTLKGGVEEVAMGQYFKQWLEQEGLIPENYIPAAGEVRFNAREKQRCRATANYFAVGMLPLADVAVEYPGDGNGTEDFMAPVLHFYSDAYADAAIAQVATLGGYAGYAGISEQTRDVIRLIMDTVDMQDSKAYQSGKYGDLLTDASGYTMAAVGKEPDLTGAIKIAYQMADALILQYYEADDAAEAAFGHELSEADWAAIGEFMTTCLEMKHGAPLVSANITNPLLQELRGELENKDRKFSYFCAHDCTVLGTLSALGAVPYSLPNSIETETPVGVKLLFERWSDETGASWYRVSLVYRSTEQIRSGEMLTLENPPMRYDLQFTGVETNEDGMIAEADLLALFDRSIQQLQALEEQYGEETPTVSEVTEASAGPDYTDAANWAYYAIGEDKDADLFLICPTVDMNDEFNMTLADEDTKASFLGALNMERGIYEDSTRMFAPYYRQAAMKVYSLDRAEREPYMELAYSDVSAAFAYYLEHENNGRPIVLAGFSQGADMCYQLLMEYFGDEALYDQLVAVYAIGWPLTEEMTKAYPQIVAAQSADDLGVVISFDCEAPEVTETFINPAGQKALSINPLRWTTDGTPADKSLNPGACFTDYSGEIRTETAALCGCYIDPVRGVVKVTDVEAADYPPIVSGLPEGAYHIYDYQFFFRSLQQNVAERIESYLAIDALDPAA